MYKSKLQEMCQQRAWTLPEYDTVKHGLDHCPRFSATVTVNGREFRILDHCRSSKEAQNNAAKLAFDHFSLPDSDPNPNPNPNPRPSPSLNPTPTPNPNPSPSPSPNPNPSHSSSPRPNFNLNLIPNPSPSTSPNPNPNPSHSSKPNPNPNAKLPILSSSSFPQPSLISTSGPSNLVNELKTLHATEQTLQQSQGTVQTPHISGRSSVVNMLVNESRTSVQGDCSVKGVQHLYKNQLQNYAQKRNITLPVYSYEQEGPSHNTRYKSTVTIDGQSYGSPEFFPTLKEAENAAAKVALTSLSPDRVQEHDAGFYKNLLQELVQKEGIPLPMYSTTRTGEAHVPVFISTVTIEEEAFTGEEARSKKLAEINAAKVAYNSLKERKSSQVASVLCLTKQGQETPELVSSCLKSNISDVQQNARPKVPVISSPGTVTAEQAKDDRGKGNSLSRDVMHGDVHSTFLPDPYKFQTGSSPHLASDRNMADVDSSSKLPIESSSSSPFKRVCVYPRVQISIIPEGRIMLPMSDDNWVAFSHTEQRGN
ncbi:hypothetical protein FNV43_RR15349 [Rhamnella rubrinervis]|uniref:DRBM domain-containing protein n=1 Tax=Rhamnella rubrinervis TaxID=2594499 RepID=A0A8K0E8W0_9ROSA|nr:hypothetical protein FNV43_RR15349 [Rhamnella rubrinervis]